VPAISKEVSNCELTTSVRKKKRRGVNYMALLAVEISTFHSGDGLGSQPSSRMWRREEFAKKGMTPPSDASRICEERAKEGLRSRLR